jgi:ribosome-associated protein
VTQPHDHDGETGSVRELAIAAARAALERKAFDVVLLDVRELTSLADFFVVASGRSDTQVRAVAEAVEEHLRAVGRRPLAVEGLRHGQWVLLDYGDVVVHVFYGPVRSFYDLERLWSRAPRSEIGTGIEPQDASDGGEREVAR